MADQPVPQRVSPPTRFSVLAFISSGLVLGFLAVLLGSVVPGFEQTLRDFHLELPAPTRILLASARLFSGGGWIAVCAFPVILGFVAPRFRRSRPIDAASYAKLLDRLIAAMIVCLFILAMLIMTDILILMPMVQLIRGISASNAR